MPDDFDDEDTYEEVQNSCRCGECCRRLLIEVELEDAEREPKIKELGDPIYGPPDASGEREVEGYLLNDMKNIREGYACVFLDRTTSLCTIYETRPMTCRVFDCAGEGREQLIELGILNRE